MIAYLPHICPDELVYSWFCRYYVHSGSLNHKMALNDLFCKRSDGLSKEFVGNLNPEARERIEKIVSMKDLALKHTMFPQYGRFISGKAEAIDTLINNSTIDVHTLFTVLPRIDNDSYLKYCPLCVKEDRVQYGETYWHRAHQIRGMQVCTKHGCVLYQSKVSAISYGSFSFQPAEFNVDEKVKIVLADDKLLDYSRYIVNVFNVPIDFENEIPISAVFYKALKNNGYLKGSQRKTRQLSEDMCHFFNELSVSNIASFNQVQRVLHGSLYEFSAVCQIAFFLKVPVSKLTSPTLTQEEMTEGTSHKKAVKKDWGALDEELAPLLEKFADDIYNGINTDGRPERVALKRVCREFGLHEQSFQKLPKCKNIMERYSETQEAYWAREIMWAYNVLLKKGKPFYWSNMRKLTGIKKCNLDKILPYLADYPEIVELFGV